MTSITKEIFISNTNLRLLKSLLGKSLTSFDFDQSQYIRFNSQDKLIEVAWPGVLTLVSLNGIESVVNLDFGGENTLDECGYEIVNLRISNSNKDYSKGQGISMDWFEVSKIEVYSNHISAHLNDDEFFINPAANFVKSHNCHELEYIVNIDEILLFYSSNNKKIMLQVIESMNGSVKMHFNETLIDKILANEYHVHSPKKNFVKRLTL
ncbi:MAG: hypothetical protein IPJ64_09895 [Saprospiraceae bacterium]|nr:hypothetical protein [Saprospiraceae bacterium]MBK7796663.1 hypothetical protein [Saprospiraceae bacterium]